MTYTEITVKLNDLDVRESEYINWLINHPNAGYTERKEIQTKLTELLNEKKTLLIEQLNHIKNENTN